MKSGLAAFLAAALLPAMAIAQTPTPTSTADIAPRTELHAIPTMTVSDSDFLAGKDGKAATVAGQLRVAQGTGKLPVVILMHGSGGMGAQLDTWSRLFNAMGVSTFAIDGFTGRGLTSVNTNQAELGRLNFILDIYGALGDPRQAPARRSAAHRPDGLLARRAGRPLRQPDALSQDVEQVGRLVRGLHPVLSGLRDDLHRRHRCRRRSHPDLPRHRRRLQSGVHLQGFPGAA